MIGQEMSQSHWENQVSTATGFLTNSTHDPSAGDITASTGNGTQNDNSIFSYFGRAFYSYDDRYLVTATLRRDGSSRFAKGNRWGWFPSAALAWRVSNEKFMAKTSNVISNLKLRLGWGSTGNQNVSDWAYMAMLSSKSTPWGTGVLNGNTPNPDLKWETTTSWNVGLTSASSATASSSYSTGTIRRLTTCSCSFRCLPTLVLTATAPPPILGAMSVR